MSNSVKTIKVGVMPGEIKELAVAIGTSVQEVINLANIDPSGHEVRVDGAQVADANNTFVSANTNLVLLTKQVKGN